MRADLHVVAHAALPDGHALRFRVETGAGVRHSLAHCKQRSHNIGHERLQRCEQRERVLRSRVGGARRADGWF